MMRRFESLIYGSRARIAAQATIVLCPILVACSRGNKEATPANSASSSTIPVSVLSETSLIAIENQNPGTDEWFIQKAAANHEVEGYASRVSVKAGETIVLNVSTSRPRDVTWVLFRLGHYQGYGARRVDAGAAKTIRAQPPCSVSANTGLIECAWTPSFRVRVSPDAISGEYFFKLSTADGFESYVPIVIRERATRAKGLFQASVTTWQAYNAWGGASLYQNQTAPKFHYAGDKARRVSFDRPYEYARPLAEGVPGIELGAGQLFLSERWMIDWLEGHGYDIAYTTNIDIDADPASLSNRNLFMSVGHDEYWTVGERDALDRARNSNVSLAFFSANSGYWRVRLEPSSSGVPRRTITCYKSRDQDPRKDSFDTTDKFRSEPHARPENSLIGVMYELWTNLDAFPWIVSNPSLWVFEGTGVRQGTNLGHFVGYEWDHVFSNGVSPAGLQTLSESPAFGAYGSVADANSSIYETSENSFVFAAGTIKWSWGLSRPGFVDWRVQRITENLLRRAGLTAQWRTETGVTTTPSDVPVARSISLLAGTERSGYRDGSGMIAQFDSPVGVAMGPGGVVLVTEARNHTVRVISAEHNVTTLAGCGPYGATYGSLREGHGTEACFNVPTGIVATSDGGVYVSDTANHRIRHIDPDGNVTTYAGRYAGIADGPRESALFKYPRGLALGPSGTLYVADAGNDAVRLIDKDRVTTVCRGIREPTAIAVSANNDLYVVATAEGRIYRITPDRQQILVNVSGAFGDSVGLAGAVLLRPADGIVVDRARVVFSDSANYKLKMLVEAEVPLVTTVAGTGEFGNTLGSGAESRLVLPRGLAISDRGYVVADSGNHRIVLVSRDTDE